MIIEKDKISNYLEAYHSGEIKQGLHTGVALLDESLRFKKGQLIMINGHDNVGKTIWILWYFLCLSVKHDLKWCIWSGENKAGQLVKQLIQFYTGVRLNELSLSDVYRYELQINEWFTFIDNNNFYKSKELLALFKESGCDGAMIDPFTGMDREYTHAANYSFLNESRQFCNKTGIALYVNTHPVSEAARRTYSADHPRFGGYPIPPSKSQSEGGQPFANRPDDFITIHRLVGHPEMNYKTLIYIRKIKDTETGGKVSAIDDPVEFDFNSGMGFTLNGQNPLTSTIKDDLEMSKLTPNDNFTKEPF